jgi:hypothetical protein
MRRVRFSMRWLGAALLALAGCQTTDTNLKPKVPEEYTVPPADDARFSSPPAFPKETLDSGMLKKDKEQGKPGDQFRQPGSGFGVGPGMGRY